MTLPAILHWEFNHFVVLERWVAVGMTIVDPALGGARLGAKAVFFAFTGVALAFEPGPGSCNVARSPSAASRALPHSPARHPRRSGSSSVLRAALLLELFGLCLPAATPGPDRPRRLVLARDGWIWPLVLAFAGPAADFW